MKKKFPDTPQLLLDSGNLSGNPSPEGMVKTRGLVEGMGRLGYRAANVGERELSMGYDEFIERTGKPEFQFISTNIVRKDTGDPVFKPYVILDVETRGGGSIKVGVLGIVRFNKVFLKAGPDGSNLVIAFPQEMIARYIDEVREKSDMVILLASVHKKDLENILSEVPGIDIAIGAYGGVVSIREERVGDTLLLYSGNQGKRIGETRLFLDEENRLASTKSFMYYLTGRYPGDPEMDSFVAEVIESAKAAAPAEQAEIGAGTPAPPTVGH